MGGLVLSPTRELSMQIYDVLRKIGLKHDFSAGLVTGGKSVEEEAKVISKTNIIIGLSAQNRRFVNHFSDAWSTLPTS